MKSVTGAILILAAAVFLAPTALAEATGSTSDSQLATLTTVLSAVTATMGLIYLGSAAYTSGGHPKRFGIRSLLGLAALVAVFFSGMATGHRMLRTEMERLTNEGPSTAAERIGVDFAFEVWGDSPGRPASLDDQVLRAILLYWVGLPDNMRNTRDVQSQAHRAVDTATDRLRAYFGETEDSRGTQLPNTPQSQGESPLDGASRGSMED